jgi:hypothetical protein
MMMEKILKLLLLFAPLTVACFICCFLPSNSTLFQQAAVTMVVIFLLNVLLTENIDKTRKLATPCTESASNRSVCADQMSLDFEESNRRLVKLEIKMTKLVFLVSKINISQVRKGKVNPETTLTSSHLVAPKRNTGSGSSRSVRSHVSPEAAEYGKSWNIRIIITLFFFSAHVATLTQSMD